MVPWVRRPTYLFSFFPLLDSTFVSSLCSLFFSLFPFLCVFGWGKMVDGVRNRQGKDVRHTSTHHEQGWVVMKGGGAVDGRPRGRERLPVICCKAFSFDCS